MCRYGMILIDVAREANRFAFRVPAVGFNRKKRMQTRGPEDLVHWAQLWGGANMSNGIL